MKMRPGEGSLFGDCMVRWPCGCVSGPYLNWPTAEGAARSKHVCKKKGKKKVVNRKVSE